MGTSNSGSKAQYDDPKPIGMIMGIGGVPEYVFPLTPEEEEKARTEQQDRAVRRAAKKIKRIERRREVQQKTKALLNLRLKFLEIVKRRSITNTSKPRPPVNTEFILYLLLRKGEREGAIGDLLELYPIVLKRLGRQRANLWAYSEVIKTLWPVFKRFIGKTTATIAVVEWIRRHLN